MTVRPKTDEGLGTEGNVRRLGGQGPCPDDMGFHLLPRKLLFDSEFDTRVPALSAVDREEGAW